MSIRRGPTRNNYIFGKQATIHDVLENQRQKTKQALDELPADSILSRTMDDLIAESVERFRLDVPVLDRTVIVQLPNEEIEIDVSRDPRRAVFDRSQPFFVKGTALQSLSPSPEKRSLAVESELVDLTHS